MVGRAYAFQSVSVQHRFAPVLVRSDGFGQPALDYRSNQVGKVGLARHALVFPKHAGLPLPYIPSIVFQSKRSDLNRRSLGPQPSAMPAFATFCTYSKRKVGREALESSSPDLQPGATPSQLVSPTKKPDVVVTPGFVLHRSADLAECHKRRGCAGSGFAGL